MLANLPGWQVELCIGLILLLTLYGMTRTLILNRKLRSPAEDGTILRELERRYDQVRQWMKLQQWVALLLYPVSVAGGFMLGGSLGSGKPVGMLIQKPGWIALLVITAAILVPLCYYAGRWMSQKAFGQYADQLKEKIDSLKGEG